MRETITCTHCHQEHPHASIIEFDGQHLCPDCLREHTRVCDRCGERMWLEDVCGDEILNLCERCAELYYVSCVSCGRMVESYAMRYLSDDDAEGYCEDCYTQQLESCGIQSYYFKPEPTFYGTGPRFLGVELEIDEAGESERYAKQLLAAGNQDHPHIYIKHDGSLNDGLEIVTHPMSLDYHRHEMPWTDIIHCALSLGYSSHTIGTCGLHVHVSRSSLGTTEEHQEDTIARILFFVETHWNELLRFSRRTRRQMEKWAARYGRRDDPKAILDSAKSASIASG